MGGKLFVINKIKVFLLAEMLWRSFSIISDIGKGIDVPTDDF